MAALDNNIEEVGKKKSVLSWEGPGEKKLYSQHVSFLKERENNSSLCKLFAFSLVEISENSLSADIFWAGELKCLPLAARIK